MLLFTYDLSLLLLTDHQWVMTLLKNLKSQIHI